jgi:hypothetical protein
VNGSVKATWAALLTLLALSALLALTSGCGTPATIARKTITAIDVANAQAPRFARVAVRQCIDKAVAAKSEADLQKCADLRDKILKGVRISIDATDVAAAGVDLAEAGAAKDFSALLEPALRAARAMAQLLNDAGVKMPSIPLVWP